MSRAFREWWHDIKAREAYDALHDRPTAARLAWCQARKADQRAAANAAGLEVGGVDHLVLDLEIARTIEETPGGWDATDQLGISVAIVYDMETDRYTLYGGDEGSILALRVRLLKADRITTFNGWRFDLPVLFGLPQPCRVLPLAERSDDLLRRIWQALDLNPDVFTPAHGGWGLDAVCRATLGRGKTGHGAYAPLLYQRGQWVELINYCLEDVKLTRDLCRYMDITGTVSGPRRRRLHVRRWEADTPKMRRMREVFAAEPPTARDMLDDAMDIGTGEDA